jgi:hypothetical protein
MTTKFSQFTDAVTARNTDIVVGLRDDDNVKFTLEAGIADDNGNILLGWGAVVASATGYVTLTNAITGNAPTIGVAGVSSDIPLTIESEGTGDITFTPGTSGQVICNATTAIQVPAGTQAQRPGTGVAGQFRYDTDTDYLEYWDVSVGDWVLVIAGAAFDTATYITQTDETADLPNSQPLSALSTGMAYVTTTTGVVGTRTLTGTANQIDVADGTGGAGNPTFSLSSTLVAPGTVDIGNLNFDTNTISATDTNGNIIISADGTGFVNVTDNFIAGDAGTESTGITIHGVNYDSVAKVSDIGGTNVAQIIHHRHSTTLAPLVVGARSNSNTSTHGAVTNGQALWQVFGAGWDGADYELGAAISFEVDGTPGLNDMPGRIVFNVTPDGGFVPVEALRLSQDKSALFGGTADIGNLNFDTNTITATDTNGDIILTPDGTGMVNATSNLVAGDPGTEGNGITVHGVTYNAALKVGDMGSSRFAQLIMDRHSTSYTPLILGARSNSDTSSHAAVTDGQYLLQLSGTGYDGTDYEFAATITMEVDGTPASNDMPGRIVFWVTPSGGIAVEEAVRISQNKLTTFSGNIRLDGTKLQIYDGAGTGFATLGAPAGNFAGNVAYTWPDNAPAASGYVLSSTTGGVMSWIAPGGGGTVTSVTATAPLTSSGGATPDIAMNGLTGLTQGDLIYASAADTFSNLAKDTNATRYLSNTGTSNNPAWAQVDLTNGVTGTLPVTSGGTGVATLTTAYGVLCAGTTATGAVQTLASLGSAGEVLTSQGAGSLPTWSAASGGTAASQAEMETATATNVYVSPGRQQYHPSSPKYWVSATTITTTAIIGSYNVTSLTDNGTGDTTVTIATDFSDITYASVCCASGDGSSSLLCMANTTGITYSAPTVGAARFTINNVSIGASDSHFYVVGFGDQ